MSTHYTRDFTGTNGDPWTDYGFVALVGGAGLAIADISSNAGHAGSVGEERVYGTGAYIGPTGRVNTVGATWSNAGGAARIAGVGDRWQDAGATGYMGQLDSNLGTPRARIRRRSGGSWADVVAWTATPGSVNTALLNSGLDLELRVRTVDENTVNLQLYVGTTQLLDVDDTNAARIEQGGTAALYIDVNSTLNDVVYDDLAVTDLEDEWAGLGSLSSDTALVVDGEHYSWEDLVAAGVLVTLARQSYGTESPAKLGDTLLFHTASSILYPGAWVRVAIGGTVVAVGKLAAADQALTPAEGHTYTLRSPKDLAADVIVRDATTGSTTLVANVASTHIDYESTRDGIDVGAFISAVIDAHTEGEGSLRDLGAAPPSGAVYDPADLSGLGDEVPEMAATGDVLAAVEALLSFTNRMLFINPDTLQWEFHTRAGTQTDVDLAASHVTGSIKVNPTKNVTRLLFLGTRPTSTQTTIDNGGAGALNLVAGWDAAAEAAHTSEKGFKNTDTGLVASSTTTGGKGQFTADLVGPPVFATIASGWVGTRASFVDGPEAGNTYDVQSNTALGVFIMTEAWTSGGPAAGNTFTLRGNAVGGGRDYAHREVGRRYLLDDLSKGLTAGICNNVQVTQGEIAVPTKAVLNTPVDPTEAASVTLDLPAIGLFNTITPQPVCEEGASPALVEADVQVTLETYERTDPQVPSLFIPATGGYYGSAFSFDATRWGVAGAAPGHGSYGHKRTLVLSVPAFDGSAAHVAAYTTVGDAMLEVLGPLAREVVITLHDTLDTAWAGLDKRLTISDSGGRTTGYETLTDLPVVAVEWNPALRTTTIYAGHQGAGEYDANAQRQAIMSRLGTVRAGLVARDWNQLLACVKNAVQGGGAIGGPSPATVCADQVTMYNSRTDRSTTVNNKCVHLEEVLDGTAAILEAQKGGAFEWDSDSESLYYQNEEGDWFVYNEDTGVWDPTTGLGDAPTADGDTDGPWDDLDDFGGWEGRQWDAIKGLAANLGKTINIKTGVVKEPGTGNAVDGDVKYGRNSAGGITETPLTPGGNVPPNVLGGGLGGGVFGNLEKTEDPLGGILIMNGAVGASGASYHSEGATVALASGDTTPGAASDALQYAISMLFSFDGAPVQDKAGMIWTET